MYFQQSVCVIAKEVFFFLQIPFYQVCRGRKGGIGPTKGKRADGFGGLVGLGVVGALVVVVSAVSLSDEMIWNPV